jgi:hypothetical protein
VQTGVSVDSFDCPILQWSLHYNEPDPMIFKAIIYVESRFADMSVGNYNSYGSTTSCTAYNMDYDHSVLAPYQQYAAAADYAAHDY